MAEVATKGQVIVRHGDEGDAIWAAGSPFMVKLAVEGRGGRLSDSQVARVLAASRRSTPEGTPEHLLDGGPARKWAAGQPRSKAWHSDAVNLPFKSAKRVANPDH